jgi:prophage regulatory protein
MRKNNNIAKTPIVANQFTATIALPDANSVALQPLAVPAPSALLRLPKVLARFPVSRSSWYDGIKRGIYPKPYQISRRTVAWDSASIDALIARQCGTGATDTFNATKGDSK